MHERFPFDMKHKAEFIEINTSLPRLLQSCVVPDSEWASYKRSPWRDTPGTLIGSGKVAVRYVCSSSSPSKVVARLLELLEYLLCVGWSTEFCEQNYFTLDTLGDAMIDPIKPHERLNVATYADLIGDMAGNAWSAYSYVGAQVARMAVSGKFLANADVIQVSDTEGQGAQDTQDLDNGGGVAADSSSSSDGNSSDSD